MLRWINPGPVVSLGASQVGQMDPLQQLPWVWWQRQVPYMHVLRIGSSLTLVMPCLQSTRASDSKRQGQLSHGSEEWDMLSIAL